MTEHEERRVREYLAFSHQDGKCIVYADDGELQCNNMIRHGRCIDFRREPISDILDTVEQTRWKEVYANPSRTSNFPNVGDDHDK